MPAGPDISQAWGGRPVVQACNMVAAATSCPTRSAVLRADHFSPSASATVHEPETFGDQGTQPRLYRLRVGRRVDQYAAVGIVSGDRAEALAYAHVKGMIHVFVSGAVPAKSEEHTSELQSLMRISYAVFCLKKNNIQEDLEKKPCSTL